MESSELLLGRPFGGCAILYRKEICLNNIIRKIWCLSQQCHTSLLQLISGLSRSQNLASLAIQSSSRLISDVFLDSSNLIYTSTGYNLTFGHKHWKVYTDSDNLTSKFLFDVKMNPSLNSSLLEDINFICTSYTGNYLSSLTINYSLYCMFSIAPPVVCH